MKLSERIQYHDCTSYEIHEDGTVLVPRTHQDGNYLCIVERLKLTDEEVVLHIDIFVEHGRHLIYDRHIQTLSVDDNGTPRVSERGTEPSEWCKWVRTISDLVKNPLNTPVHQFLNAESEPLMVKENVYIAADESVYINTNLGWMPLDGGIKWLENNHHRVHKKLAKAYQEYKLMAQLAT